jgi:pimeloyl-ACP methyl ester carboxylesterase
MQEYANAMLKVVIGLLVSFLLATFQLQAQEASFQFEEKICPFYPFDTPLVECGTVTLPENRSLPNGQQVEIAVAIFPAVGKDPVADPLFFLDGGPGAPTLQRFGGYFNTTFSAFNETRDVVLVDYRGAGESEPSLYCDEVLTYYNATYGQKAINSQSLESYSEALDACRTRLMEDEQVDLSMYNSAVIAQDIADLRETLGYDEVNLLGASYGTRLALTLLRDRPDGIRSVILDGVYPPQVNIDAENLVNMNRAFEELFTSCAQSSVCNAAFPNLRDQFFAAANRLNDVPTNLAVDIADYDEEYTLPFNGNSFINYIFSLLYNTSLVPALPLIIHQAAEGNYAPFRQIASVETTQDMSRSLGLYLAIQCTEERPFNDMKQMLASAEQVPTLSAFFFRNVNPLTDQVAVDSCGLWGTDEPNPIENEPVYSDVPVLIMNGQFDPITPPSWGERAAQTLSKSQVITFPGVGHGATVSGACPQKIVVDFLDAPEGKLDISCINDTPINWVTVDLSDSMADVEMRLEKLYDWEVDPEYQKYMTYQNAALWWNYYDSGVLHVTDWLASTFPQTVDNVWFEGVFRGWGRYELQRECSQPGISLYEFSATYDDMRKGIVRYWVDRRDPQKVREVFLSMEVDSSVAMQWSSQNLFAELPTCSDEALLPADWYYYD